LEITVYDYMNNFIWYHLVQDVFHENLQPNYLILPVKITELLREMAVIWVELLFLEIAVYDYMNNFSLLSVL
jgi:hypothetical protein